jgi:hypothetical protein
MFCSSFAKRIPTSHVRFYIMHTKNILTARVSSDSPSYKAMILLLILCTIRQVSRWVPLVGIRVDGGIEVNIAYRICNEGARGNEFAPVGGRDWPATDVSPHCGAKKIKADGVA